MIYADVKADVKQLEKNNLQLHLATSYKKCILNLKYNVKQMCIFYLILLGIPSSLMLSAKKKGQGGGGQGLGRGLLNIQNLLSVMKVICWQSLTRFYCTWFSSVQKKMFCLSFCSPVDLFSKFLLYKHSVLHS